jgi:hypothetical protein
METEDMAELGREDSANQTRAPRLEPVGEGDMTKSPSFWTKVSEAIETYRDEE